ncbi:MAG: DUF1549 domain-containing protein [Verrucomicrobiales bacterium]
MSRLPKSAGFFLLFPAVAPLAAAEVDFAHQVVPILRNHCAECHMGENRKAGLSMNTRESLLQGSEYGPVVEAGKGEDSVMIEAMLSDDKVDRMPPKGPRVPPEDIEFVRRWIDEGMKWEPGFTFGKDAYEPPLKPRNPELPPARDGREHPIDRIVDHYLAEKGVPHPQPIDDATFLRRISLDLTGLLPSQDEIATFVADPAPDKRAKRIAALLDDDTAYADHWLAFWNDLLRNDYQGTGYIDGGRTQITSWLYQALRENKPYDQFARELLSPPTKESAGFINGIQWRGTVNASQTREVQFSQSISQTFLGLNMKCASCHDSFVDRWKLDEAYGLAAIFSEKPIEIARCDKPTGRMATPAWIFPELGNIDANAPKAKRLEQLAGLMTHPENGRFCRTMVNRLWQRLMGHGIVHPVDAMDTPPWNADLLDHLAVRFTQDGYDIRKALAYIAGSSIYQSECVNIADPSEHKVFRGPVVKRLTAEQFMDAVWSLTGTAPANPHAAIQAARKATPDGQAASFTRASLVPADLLMRALGRPNREQIVSMRPDTVTTLEAIDLANGNQLTGLLKQGAAKLAAAKDDTGAMVEEMYLQALTRPPTSEEKSLLVAALGPEPSAQAIEDFLWMILLLPEFQFVR